MHNVLNGLLILSKYEDHDSDISAEHDQIWAGFDNASTVTTQEDMEALKVFGWFIDEEHDCWSCFV